MTKKITIDGKLSAAEIKRKAAAAEVLYGPLRAVTIRGDFPAKVGDDIFLSAVKPLIRIGKKYVTILLGDEEVSFDPLEGTNPVQYVEIYVECPNSIN